jgi:hypothetical protein
VKRTGLRFVLAAVAAATLLTLVFGAARRFDPFPEGLGAEYFSNPTWAGPAAFSRLDRQPSTDALLEAWHDAPPAAFGVTWVGAVVALSDGTYTFATNSDDGSEVYVDGRLVVDNGGGHASRLATGSISLTRGAHALFIRYFQEGGSFNLDFLWARDGSNLALVPSWALRARKASSLARLAPSLLVSWGLAATGWIWLGVVVAAAAAGARPLVAHGAFHDFLERTCAWSTLRWIVAGSFALNAVGVWWGLPAMWAPNELTPGLALEAAAQHFAHGWYDVYPPVHFYVLLVALGPILLVESARWVAGPGYMVAVLACRLVSVLAGAGTVLAAGVCGSQAFGRRAGLFAAGTTALVAPFLFYVKTANVDAPYIFWFALSLVFYLRLLDALRLADFLLFAVTATIAVCTKDQAYGLYLSAPAVIVYRLWQVNRVAGGAHPFRRAVFDGRLAASAAAAAVLFVLLQNLVANFDGFVNHVRYITGPGSEGYRAFEPTVAGRLALLRLTFRLTEQSMGWPLFLVSLAGLAVAAGRTPLRGRAAWLLALVASYYLGFVDVILYNYDRFVIPVCLVLALFGGLALDVFLSSGKRRSWRAAAVVGLFAYSLLYAGTVDALMVGDSRYAVERWMDAHVGHDDVVGFTGPREILPRLDTVHAVDVSDVEDLERQRPIYFIVNADYARAVPPDTRWGQINAGLQGGTLGYRLVFRFRRGAPWPWLPGAHPDLVGPREETAVFSTLRDVDPTIEVFERAPADARPEAR